jgi:energy-coupling factor transport system permease protein
MDMFLYIDKKTPVHRLDPRTKLLLMFLSFVLALSFRSFVILSSVLVAVLLYGAAGSALSNLRRIRVVLMMIASFSVVIWSVATPSDSRFLLFSLEGLLYGVMVAIKTDLMIISGMIFLSTTKIEEIAGGLVKLKLPYRGAFAFSTAIRLVPMIVATSYTIIQAQKSRGLDLDSGSMLQRVRKYVPLVVPTLVSVIRGTNVFSMALESKGFGYSDTRTNLLELRMKRNDWLTLGGALLVVAAAFFFNMDSIAYGACLFGNFAGS